MEEFARAAHALKMRLSVAAPGISARIVLSAPIATIAIGTVNAVAKVAVKAETSKSAPLSSSNAMAETANGVAGIVMIADAVDGTVTADATGIATAIAISRTCKIVPHSQSLHVLSKAFQHLRCRMIPIHKPGFWV